MGKKFDLAGLMAGQKAVSESDTITMIPIDKLISDERNFYTVDDVQDLMDSIAVSGVLQPILVAQAGTTDAEGWRIIAGHRRTKAVSLLRKEWAKEGPCPYDRIPAVVRPAPTTREEELLEELALIATNSAARKLSDVEISKQAERMQELFYELKKEGYDFPGRMRTQVAKAVGVSESKLARLKTIREHLTPKWLERWEAGSMTESGAEALAKLRPEVQDALLRWKAVMPDRTNGIEKYYELTHTTQDCEVKKGSQCDHLQTLWEKGMAAMGSWERCPYGHYRSEGPICCGDCIALKKCKSACKLAKSDTENSEKREAERQRREQAAEIERAQESWRRLDEIIDEHGVSREEADKLLGVYFGISKHLSKLGEDRDMNAYALSRTVEQACGFKGIYNLAKKMGLPPEAITDPDWEPEEVEPVVPADAPALVLMPRETEDGKVWTMVDPADVVTVGSWYPTDGDTLPEDGSLVLILRNHRNIEYWEIDPQCAVYRDGTWYHAEKIVRDVEWADVRYWSPWPSGGPEVRNEEA